MRGYFSRIAKQCDLRYSGREAELRPLPSVKPADGFFPLEREETVMVPPPLPGIKTEEAIASDGEHKPHITPALQSAQKVGLGEKPPAHEEVSAQAPAKHNVKVVLKEQPTVFAPFENGGNDLPELKKNKSEQDSVSGRFSVFDQTISKESERSNGTRERDRPPDSREAAGREEVKPSHSAPASDSGNKEYFSRTAGIIDKKEPGTANIQTAVFHDVREWVAASPVDAATEQTHSENLTAVLLSDGAQPRVPEGVNVRESAQNQCPEHAGLRERSFDLSIGAISVVIEELPKPRQSEPPVRQNSAAAVKAYEPRFLRLTRSYL
jgi:hypothetical protein